MGIRFINIAILGAGLDLRILYLLSEVDGGASVWMSRCGGVEGMNGLSLYSFTIIITIYDFQHCDNPPPPPTSLAMRFTKIRLQ